MYMKAGACGSQQRTLDPVELDFPGQEVTACGPLCSLPHAIHDCAAEKAAGVSSSPHRPHQKEEHGKDHTAGENGKPVSIILGVSKEEQSGVTLGLRS